MKIITNDDSKRPKKETWFVEMCLFCGSSPNIDETAEDAVEDAKVG